MMQPPWWIATVSTGGTYATTSFTAPSWHSTQITNCFTDSTANYWPYHNRRKPYVDTESLTVCARALNSIRLGETAKIKLPDESVLHVEASGRYHIEDKDAKVTYRGNRVREFNCYINASDLLGEFIDFLGTLGVRQSEALNVPIELFINWLILRAAEKDQVDPPASVRVIGHPLLPSRRWTARCSVCKRFIPRRNVMQQLPFCGEPHMRLSAHRLWGSLTNG